MSNQIQATGAVKIRSLTGVLTASTGVVSSVPLGAANGVATLDSLGKVPLSQLPASVVTYLGTWNAATNTPTLVNGVGDVGDLYICNVAGTVNFGAGPIVFAVGDWVIYSGTTWQKSSGQAGTVTSVAASITGNSVGITGSPITTSGTLAFAFAGNSAQYINGAGNLATFPTLTGYVPYTGATANVDLGTYGLISDYIRFNLSSSAIPTTEGTMSWNNTDGTADLIMKGGNVTLQIGQEQLLRVVNKTGVDLLESNYSVVYLSGAQGQRPKVSLGLANNSVNSAATLGLVTETIPNNLEGFITTSGMVREINTTGSLQGETWSEGQALYLSPTIAGAVTNIPPTEPNHRVVIGYVIYAHAVHGSIFVKVSVGLNLDDLNDVEATAPANNDGLFYNSSTSIWQHKSIATALNYTPANDSLVVHLAGTETITGLKNFSSVITAYTGGGIRFTDNPITTTYGSIVANSTYFQFGQAGGASSMLFIANNGSAALTINSTGSVIFGSTIGNGTYTYNLPSASGTLALTSSLSGYVPYTGATGTVNLGYNYLNAGTITVGGSSSTQGTYLGFKQFTTVQTGTFGYTAISAYGTSLATFSFSQTDGTFKTFNFNAASITSNVVGGRTYTMPDANGTLALTSDIPSLSGYVQGSGTTNYIPKFTASGTIGNSRMTDDGTFIKASINSFQVYQSSGTGTALNFLSTGTSAQMFSYSAAYGYGTLDFAGAGISFTSAAIGGTTGTLAMNISTTGNVSIGNTNNTYKLDVSGNGYFSGSLTINNVYKITGSSIGSGSERWIGTDGGGGLFINTPTSQNLILGINNNPALVIKSTGNVGIGTSTPGALLEVANASNPSIFLTNTGAATLRLQAATGVVYVGSKTADALDFITGDAPRMRITSGGNVGINTTSTAAQLVVSSTAGDIFRALGNSGVNVLSVDNNGNLKAQFIGSNTGTALVLDSGGFIVKLTSSIRYKKDINPIDIGLDFILKLNPVNFNLIKGNIPQVGFIAEDFPDERLVSMSLIDSQDESKGFQRESINYAQIVAPLVKAIQEQNTLITDLTNRLNALETKI